MILFRAVYRYSTTPTTLPINTSTNTSILVDEFQAVNNLQVELIKLSAYRQTQLFCVGDDWQSIYGFRFVLPGSPPLSLRAAGTPAFVTGIIWLTLLNKHNCFVGETIGKVSMAFAVQM